MPSLTMIPDRTSAASPPQHRELTIGLMGHSVNSENLGVGALTVSHIAILQRVCEEFGIKVKFHIFESPGGPEHYIRAANIETILLRTRHYLAPRDGLYSAIRRCDIVCDITAGDSFADIYGVSRFFRIALAKAVVLVSGRPLVLSPQTIGPFHRGWTRVIATRIMRHARAIVSRDILTSEYLEQIGFGSKVVEAADVAFRLPYETSKSENTRSVRIGINISGLLFNGGYTRSNMFGLTTDYPTLARSLVRHFAARPECEVHLISHVISETFEVEDDYRVAQQLAREIPGVVLAPRFRTPSEAKSYISGMDFFCGARMHACIAAFSSGVPVVPIAYSRKFAGVFRALDYPHIADCQADTADRILDIVIEAFQNRASLAQSVKAGSAKANEKLGAYEDVIRSCIAPLIGKKL